MTLKPNDFKSGLDTLQGASRTSDWSRGHAWALYGFTMVQRYMRGGSPCAKLYVKSNPAVLPSLAATTVAVANRCLADLPSTLQVGLS